MEEIETVKYLAYVNAILVDIDRLIEKEIYSGDS